MDTHSMVLILALILLVALSAFFSSTETAYSSLNRIRLKNRANNGDKRAGMTLSLAEDYDKLLSTILIGNNIVNIAAASIATVVFVGFVGDAGVTVSTVVMTVVVLIFGEISPKSLAKQSPERVAMRVAPVIRVCMVLFTPLNYLFMHWRKLLDRVFQAKDAQQFSEEELITLVDEVQSEGAIGERQGTLIRSAIAFSDLTAEDILTPRVRLVAVEDIDPLDEIAAVFRSHTFSRLPVYRETIDNIIGFIHEKDLHALLTDGGALTAILQKIPYVAPSIALGELLHLLQSAKTHMAAVVDEFGGTCGIVTMEDILEELVGDIWDEHDEVVEACRPLGGNRFLVAGETRLEELEDLFGATDDEEAGTVGGLVAERLGKVPEPGDHCTVGRLELTVRRSDGRFAQEVEVAVPEEAPAAPQD